jgi:hypothetical protein
LSLPVCEDSLNAHDAPIPIDVSAFQGNPFLGPEPGPDGEDWDPAIERAKLSRDDIEFLPGKDPHLALLRSGVGNQRRGVLVQIAAADAVPKYLAERAMDVVGRARRKPLPPGADLRRPQSVDASRTEGFDGVLEAIAESLDRAVLGDVLLEVRAVAAAVALDRLYRRVLRRRVLTWGATAAEEARRLPGDELLEGADIVATRGITVEAPPSAVWPWLVQMGPGRAGAYTYDWIENLFGLNMHSADRIVPEWQRLTVGDVLRSRPERPGMRVEILEPGRILSTRSEAGDWVWTFALVPDGKSTRLLSRNRIAMKGASAGQWLGMLVMKPGSLVMERKMLHGIKERSERLEAERTERSGDDLTERDR